MLESLYAYGLPIMVSIVAGVIYFNKKLQRALSFNMTVKGPASFIMNLTFVGAPLRITTLT